MRNDPTANALKTAAWVPPPRRRPYRLIISDGTMAPRYLFGETITVAPWLAVRPGDYVVAYVRPAQPGGNELAIMRRLASNGLDRVVLHALNPPTCTTLPRSQVREMHKVVLGGE